MAYPALPLHRFFLPLPLARPRGATVSHQLAQPPAVGALGAEVGSRLFWLPATRHVVRGAVVITWALLLALRTFFLVQTVTVVLTRAGLGL